MHPKVFVLYVAFVPVQDKLDIFDCCCLQKYSKILLLRPLEIKTSTINSSFR